MGAHCPKNNLNLNYCRLDLCNVKRIPTLGDMSAKSGMMWRQVIFLFLFAVAPDHKGGLFTTVCEFPKWTHCYRLCTVWNISSILKKIPKITETLKMKNFCRQFSNIFLLLKQTIAKQKLKNLFFKTLFWAPKMGKGKANFLEFLFICWLKKSKNTFSPEAGVKSIDKTKIQYEALLRPCSKLKSNPKAKF